MIMKEIEAVNYLCQGKYERCMGKMCSLWNWTFSNSEQSKTFGYCGMNKASGYYEANRK